MNLDERRRTIENTSGPGETVSTYYSDSSEKSSTSDSGLFHMDDIF
jgi:hypothetical protein